MSKRVTLYLTRGTGSSTVMLSRRAPKAVTRQGDCGCGIGTSCPEYLAKPRTEYESGESLFDFCDDGLRKAGLRVGSGKSVELTITVKPVKPKAKAKRKTAK